MLSSLRRFSRDEVAQQRWRIMEFYDKYGEQATREAFGADRKVIRDINLLSSAVAVPYATFSGEFLHAISLRWRPPMLSMYLRTTHLWTAIKEQLLPQHLFSWKSMVSASRSLMKRSMNP